MVALMFRALVVGLVLCVGMAAAIVIAATAVTAQTLRRALQVKPSRSAQQEARLTPRTR